MTASLVLSASAPGAKRILEKIESLDLLVNRNKFGVKAMMGRTNVGPFAFATGQQPKV